MLGTCLMIFDFIYDLLTTTLYLWFSSIGSSFAWTFPVLFSCSVDFKFVFPVADYFGLLWSEFFCLGAVYVGSCRIVDNRHLVDRGWPKMSSGFFSVFCPRILSKIDFSGKYVNFDKLRFFDDLTPEVVDDWSCPQPLSLARRFPSWDSLSVYWSLSSPWSITYVRNFLNFFIQTDLELAAQCPRPFLGCSLFVFSESAGWGVFCMFLLLHPAPLLPVVWRCSPHIT